MRRRLLPALAALLALGAAAGCTEEGLTGVDGAEPPGQAADAVSVSLPVDQLPLWRDTTYTGFATIGDVPFALVADQPPLESRALFRLDDVPDSINGEPVDSVASMVLSVLPDSGRSTFSEDSATLELFSLAKDFDDEEATWERAAAGSPWDTAGGDLRTRLADLTFRRAAEDTLASDTLRLPFRPDRDSLISAWSEAGRVPPLALRVRGEGTRLVIRNLSVVLEAKNADMDSLDRAATGLEASTFIHDPELPPVGQELRVGGLPASRFYFVFEPPDTVGGIPIRGAQVNRAELVFRPVSPAGSPFRPPVVLSSLPTGLLADPFQFGARTPIGDAVGDRRLVPLDPDSLSAGRPLAIRVNELLQAWADADPDTLPPFRVGIRAVPDGQDLGFWDFGSAEAPAGARPVLRLLITPPTDFRLP